MPEETPEEINKRKEKAITNFSRLGKYLKDNNIK